MIRVSSREKEDAMTTFSQLVDELTKELVRPDLKSLIASSINQTIREAHTGDKGQRYLFSSNRVESLLTVPDGSQGVYNWLIPNARLWQKLDSIYYTRTGVYPIEGGPKRVHDFNANCAVWYRSGDYICMKGYGSDGDEIQVSLFYYPAALKYHDSNTALATFDLEDGWKYAASVDPSTYDSIQALYSNWILMRWTDYVREGCRTKIFRRLGDQVRGTMSYSAWQDGRRQLQQQEQIDGSEAEYQK